jgi:AcrR family transcriptional regulator
MKKAPNQLSTAREQELLEAARDIFIEEGLGRATMDQIARRARVSKATIYRRYRNKEALFEAVVNDEVELVAAELSDYELDINDPRQTLRNAASAIYQASTSDRNIELRRLLIAQGRRYPDLCQGARNRLAQATSQRLTAFFQALIDQGRMRPVDPAQAATTFSLVMSGGLRPLFNIRHTEAETRHAEMDMTLFLEGWGIGKHQESVATPQSAG